MFESFRPTRQRGEDALLPHHRRIMAMGKNKFVACNTVIFGNGFFAILRLPILCHFWYGRTIDHHGRVLLASIGLPLCIAAGLAISLSMWRSWVRVETRDGDYKPA
jgi:hypothetical protein